MIAKPGGGQRELGIPTVLDRLIQQWGNSDGLLKTVLTIAYFDRLGLPRLS